MARNFTPKKRQNKKADLRVYSINRTPWLAPSPGAGISQDVGFPATLGFKDHTDILRYPEKVTIAEPRGHK